MSNLSQSSERNPCPGSADRPIPTAGAGNVMCPVCLRVVPSMNGLVSHHDK